MDEDRRKSDRNSHDTLIRIDANLSNFMRRFDEHTALDLESFNKLEIRTGRLEKFMWVMLGAVIIVNFAAKFFK